MFDKKKVLFTSGLVACLLLCSLTGCGKKTVRQFKIPPVAEGEFTQRYVNEEIGFYFDYPPDWKLYDQLKDSDHGTTILISPFSGKEVTRLNINVVSGEFRKVKTVIDESFVEETKKGYVSQGQEVLEITRGKVKNTYPAVVAGLRRKVGPHTVLSRQIIFISGTRLFVITLQGRDDLYTDMEKTLNFFFDGFHVVSD